ncbi:MAG: hypothetical protein A2293_06745 [Elusimicrobia bacterium RIFOXYB2_FULL_49_7]|nr:MAG: hypothetical protein A2293_06745 [Elusimicrobia bacterium RIFOXYB2_FULL_49_7]
MSYHSESNKLEVLHSFFDSASLSAPDIVKASALSRPTVDALLNELLSKGLISKRGTGQSTGGRKPVLFSLNGTGRFSIGVAVSIPGISGVVVDLSGTIHASESIALPIWSSGEDFVSCVAELILRLIAKVPDAKRFQGIGVAIPGLVDQEKGISVFFSRLSNFFNAPLKDMLEKKVGCSVSVSRYLGSAAYSQLLPLQNNANKSLMYVELAEGIEMALFYQGRPYRGHILNEGGLGHMVIEKGGRTCLCGAKGCLEAYASNRVLIDEAKLQVRNGVVSKVPQDREMDENEFYYLVRGNDPLALSVAEKGIDYLALGIANVVNLLNPTKIIISGAIASAGEGFLDGIRTRIRHYTLKALGEELDIVFLPFRLEEGAKGVALLRLYQDLNILN